MRTPYELTALAAFALVIAGAARNPAIPVSVHSAAARAEKNSIAAAGKYGFKRPLLRLSSEK
jgi:hypothetical protein